jgi:L-lactate dehydrogenase
MKTDCSSATHKHNLVIIGAGRLGSTIAFSSLMNNTADIITLIDTNDILARGEAMDMFHGLPYMSPAVIRAGGMEACAEADVIVIAAGLPRKTGESRLELMQKNLIFIPEMASKINALNSHAIIIILTNPVDIITTAFWKLSGIDPDRVIGTGTLLDTSRLRSVLSRHFDVDARCIQADVIGEHGDSQVIAWSSSRISGSSIKSYSFATGRKWDDSIINEMENKIRKAGAEIINLKGSSFYAIAMATAKLIKAIMRDERSVFTLSTVLNGENGINDIALSMPCLIGSSGRIKILPIDLNPDESNALRHSAKVLVEAYRSTGISH